MNGKRSNRLSERSIKEIEEKDLSEEKERRLITAKVIGRVDMGIGSIILEEIMIMMMIVMMIMIRKDNNASSKRNYDCFGRSNISLEDLVESYLL